MAFVAVLQTAVVRSSAVFVRLSEEQVGENDLLFTPRLVPRTGSTGSPTFWVNETFMRERLANVSSLSGTAPRWTLLARASAGGPRNVSCVLLVLGNAREQAIGVGRTWTRRPLGNDETYVSTRLLRDLGLRGGRGDRITITVDLLELAATAGASFGNVSVSQVVRDAADGPVDQFVSGVALFAPPNSTVDFVALLATVGITVPPPFNASGTDLRAVPVSALSGPARAPISAALTEVVVASVLQLLRPSVSLAIIDDIPGPDGKYPGSLSNVVMIELSAVASIVTRAFPANMQLALSIIAGASSQVSASAPGTSAAFAQLSQFLNAATMLDTVRLEDYALLVVGTVANREVVYRGDTASIGSYFVRLTNSMYERLGFDFAAEPTTPLATSIEGIQFV